MQSDGAGGILSLDEPRALHVRRVVARRLGDPTTGAGRVGQPDLAAAKVAPRPRPALVAFTVRRFVPLGAIDHHICSHHSRDPPSPF